MAMEVNMEAIRHSRTKLFSNINRALQFTQVLQVDQCMVSNLVPKVNQLKKVRLKDSSLDKTKQTKCINKFKTVKHPSMIW